MEIDFQTLVAVSVQFLPRGSLPVCFSGYSVHLGYDGAVVRDHGEFYVGQTSCMLGPTSEREFRSFTYTFKRGV